LHSFLDGVTIGLLIAVAVIIHDFADGITMASLADLEGVEVPFLHINHLIENKKIVNRPKDQVDVIELEKIRKIREENP
jgi:hypothetical protein